MTRKIMKSVQEKAAAGKGSIKVVKAAYFDPPVTGAGYGVYTDEACTHAVDALWIGLEGPDYDIASNLALGTYYIKEFSAPDQYELDKNVYSVTLTQSSPEATVTSLEPTKEPHHQGRSVSGLYVQGRRGSGSQRLYHYVRRRGIQQRSGHGESLYH